MKTKNNQTTAARELGVNFTHLHRVLRGERPSRRLLDAVSGLPVRKEISR